MSSRGVSEMGIGIKGLNLQRHSTMLRPILLLLGVSILSRQTLVRTIRVCFNFRNMYDVVFLSVYLQTLLIYTWCVIITRGVWALVITVAWVDLLGLGALLYIDLWMSEIGWHRSNMCNWVFRFWLLMHVSLSVCKRSHDTGIK